MIDHQLFTGFGSVHIVKNCDLGLENAFSRPRSQFFTIRTSQPVNNIYVFKYTNVHVFRLTNIIEKLILMTAHTYLYLAMLRPEKDSTIICINMITICLACNTVWNYILLVPNPLQLEDKLHTGN